MIKRRVFFSFHYPDIFRVNQIRHSQTIDPLNGGGFYDASLWEASKVTDDAKINKIINDALERTTVTVVLIGAETSNRYYVDYEIKKSKERGNALLGIHIHNIKCPHNGYCNKGNVPARLIDAGALIYPNWDRDQFGRWIEDAYQRTQNKIPKTSNFRW